MTVIFSYEHVSKVRLKKVHFDCLREYRVSNLGQELDFRRVESYGWGGAGGGWLQEGNQNARQDPHSIRYHKIIYLLVINMVQALYLGSLGQVGFFSIRNWDIFSLLQLAIIRHFISADETLKKVVRITLIADIM